jgi:Leucine-rich repeat (LRR) protein
LKQLWISYNVIDSLNGLSNCQVLENFFIAHNRIKDWAEVDKLRDLKSLSNLVLLGNEIAEKEKGSEGIREFMHR